MNKFFRNKNGELVIIQMFNLPLTAWLVFLVAAQLSTAPNVKSGLEFLSAASLVTWAYLEAKEGESGFRQALGIIVLIGIILSHFKLR